MRSLFLAGLFLAVSSTARPEQPRVSQDPPLPSYEAPWATDSLRIDGLLSEAGWERAPWSSDFIDIRGSEYPTPHLTTRVKVLWDSTYLYVGAHLVETDLWGTLTTRDAIIYRDDDFELFLDPDGDGEDYYEIEINALGTVLDLFLPKPYRRGGRADLEWDAHDLKSAVHLRGTLNDPTDRDEGWTVELALPWSDLVPPGTPPSPGAEWRVNFSRVDWPLEVFSEEGSEIQRYRKTPQVAERGSHPEQNWVWSPQGAINMHLPEKWGLLRFLGPGEG